MFDRSQVLRLFRTVIISAPTPSPTRTMDWRGYVLQYFNIAPSIEYDLPDMPIGQCSPCIFELDAPIW